MALMGEDPSPSLVRDGGDGSWGGEKKTRERMIWA